jgi:cell division protein FtsB
MRLLDKTMKAITGLPVLCALMALVLTCACVREGTKKSVSRAKKSIPTLKPVTPKSAHAGLDAMEGELEQAERNLGKPKEPVTPIDFTKETAGQKGTVEAVANTKELKTQLDAAETRNRWLLGIGMSLLGLLGVNGVWLKRAIGTVRVLRENLATSENQVNSLVEGTQEVIAQAKDNPVSPDMIKKIHREYQEVHGTWHTLKKLVDSTKAAWAAGQPSTS